MELEINKNETRHISCTRDEKEQLGILKFKQDNFEKEKKSQ